MEPSSSLGSFKSSWLVLSLLFGCAGSQQLKRMSAEDLPPDVRAAARYAAESSRRTLVAARHPPTPEAQPFKRRTRPAPRTEHSWENLLLAPEHKVAICAIQKNGWSIMSPLMGLMNSINLTHRPRPFTICAYHNRNCPAAFGREWRNTSHLKGIFDDPGWRTAVVLREPMERYISGYNSKCNHSIATDRGGPKTCEHLLHIAGPDVHLDSVAHQLTAPQIWPRGISDPHWAPQHTFCGSLTNNSLRRYTSVIPYRDIRGGLAAVLAGRMPPDHGVRTQLGKMLGVDWVDNGTAFTRKNSPPPPPSKGRTHIFHSESMVCQLSRESRALLAKAYWADYELQDLQNLPRDIEVACREKSGRHATT